MSFKGFLAQQARNCGYSELSRFVEDNYNFLDSMFEEVSVAKFRFTQNSGQLEYSWRDERLLVTLTASSGQWLVENMVFC